MIDDKYDKNDILRVSSTTVVSSGQWENVLCDDVLLQLLSYLDVKSAVYLLKGTNRSWRLRAEDLMRKVPHLWQLWYDRCGFAPSKLIDSDIKIDNNNCSMDKNCAWNALVTSRRLSRNIFGGQNFSSSSSRKAKKYNCFSLPNRRFSFFPVVPDDHSWWFPENDGGVDDSSLFLHDPPPVSFDCDSFLLTGQGTEFVLLNPFTLTVTVHQSVLNQVLHSDEGMLEQEFRAASHRIVQQRGDTKNRNRHNNNTTIPDNIHINRHIIDENSRDSNQIDHDDDDDEYLLAADAIDETLHRNHFPRPYSVFPIQTLVDLSDTVYLNLHHYFTPPNHDADGHRGRRHTQEYELSYGGIDAKPVWKNGVHQGTMLALGRIIARISDDQEDCCWEILTWKKGIGRDDSYKPAGSFRFRGTCHTLDVCPQRNVVYVNPSRQAGQNEDDWAADDNIFALWAGQKRIQVIPLFAGDNDTMSKPTQPVAEWECQDKVTAMIVSPVGVPTGKGCVPLIIVGTVARNLELYEPTGNGATLKQMICVPSAIRAAEKHCDTVSFPLERMHPAPVTEIFCSKELPVEKSGFWTLQHNAVHGSTLVLWRRGAENATYDVESIIHLPLSSQRTPKILYDGRRLLVYGQDHIGMVLLVYHVRYSNEDLSVFGRVPVGESTCGGVINVGHTAATRFANRIRHVALSGMESIMYEALYMTANERFVILNTKSGDLLSSTSTSPHREGLLVIDLQDEE